ncbi:hypothetical protein CO641_07660 [Lysobacteraceae bacterium NML91-0213]|nr:hypothetical protein CO641_07660 [Xanthomonadaceae bacterium NML91-0213]
MTPDHEENPMHRILLATSLAVLLGACDGTPTETAPSPAATSDVASDAAPHASPGVGVPADDAGVPDSVVISTNEPFFQARVEEGVLTLTGVDAGERRIPVERSEVDGGVRVIVAGGVEARVREAPCEDSMSGASFPLSGELIVDGSGPHAGCARPAAMPPPGEPGAVADHDGAAIPSAFIGRWAPHADACSDAHGLERITITAEGLRFYESTATPHHLRTHAADDVSATFAYEGEGQRWEHEQRLRLIDADTLEVTGPDDLRLRRVRCPT